MTTAIKDRQSGTGQTNGAKPDQELAPPVDRSLAAEASSAHSRINIPFNLDNWKDFSDEVREELMWFHQWILNEHVSYKDAQQAIGYSNTVIYRVLKGIYPGKIEDVARAIRSFRKLHAQRASIQRNEFSENSISKLIFAAIDYAMANNKIGVVIGESRSGKTIAGKAWADLNNHGRSVFVTAPVIGGAAGLVRAIGGKLGINKNRSSIDILESIYRAFNKNRILIVDEAHRLMPTKLSVVNPQMIELIRDIHDQTECAVVLLATHRFTQHLKKGFYQYEQLIGRVGQPILIPPRIKRTDILPIVQQFVKKPSTDILDEMERVANQPGRLGIMVETLKVATRIAHKAKEPINDGHVRKAIAIRIQHTAEAH